MFIYTYIKNILTNIKDLMSANRKSIFIVTVILILSLSSYILIVNYIRYVDLIDERDSTIEFERDEVKKIKKKNGEIVYETKVLLIEKDDLLKVKDKRIEKLSKDIKGLQNLISSVYVKNDIRIDTVLHVITDTILSNDTILADGRKHYRFKDNWVDLRLDEVCDDSLGVTLAIKNDFTINYSFKRDRSYKDKKIIVTLHSNNPYLSVSELNSIVIDNPKKKMHETKGFAFLLGFLLGNGTGVAIGSKL